MKLRSLIIAICLGCMLYLAPATSLYLFNLSFSPGLPTQEQEVGMPNRPQQQTTATPLPVATVTQPAVPLFAVPTEEMANLDITQSSSAAVVNRGDPLIYTIQITNTGPVTAFNLTIYDALPAGLRFDGISSLTVQKGVNPQLNVSQRALTGTVDALQPTGTVLATGSTIVEESASEARLHNIVRITAANVSSQSKKQASIDITLLATTPIATPTAIPLSVPPQTATPLPTATLAATATEVPNVADLQISKSAAPNPVQPGAILTYTIRVSNDGPNLARNVVIHDQLPPGLRFEGPASLSVLHGEAPSLLLSSTQLTGTVSTLLAGGVITITAPTHVLATVAATSLANGAMVTATTPDAQPFNNRASVAVTFRTTIAPDQKSFLPIVHN